MVLPHMIATHAACGELLQALGREGLRDESIDKRRKMSLYLS